PAALELFITAFFYKAQFLGGISDGFDGLQSPFIYKAQYLGGISDGFEDKQTPFIYKAQYLGGISDGFDDKQSPFHFLPQYLGGYNDGFIAKQSPFHLSPLYLGGFGDGFADKNSPIILLPLYLGGFGDGFADKNSPIILQPQYLGGLTDGFFSKNSPLILNPAYLGGIADGFLQMQPKPEFVPAFAGGISDGFAKRTVPCDTTTIHIYADSMVCPKDTLFLTTDTIPGAEYFWKGPGGWTSSEQSPVRPNFNQSMVGTYEVKLVSKNCPGDEDGWPTAVKYIGAKKAEKIYAVIDTILPGFDVCEGTPITFKVRGYGWSDSLNTNPPHFEWRLNGNPLAGVPDTSTVVIDSLYNGHKVSVAVYSGLECVTDRPYVSAPITMKVELNKSVNVQIASDISTDLDSIEACEGVPVRFTQTAVHTGNNPVFIWYRNGDSVQKGGDYVVQDLQDGDQIWVDLYSSLRCVDYKPKTSNKIGVHVINKPVIEITPDQYILPGDCVEIGVKGGSDRATYTWSPLTFLMPKTDRGDTIKVCPRTPTRYKVEVNEPWKCSVSDTTWVYVVTEPRIIKHAESVVACDSSMATFRITASGVNLGYQWQVDTGDGKWIDLVNTFTNAFTPYEGVHTNTLRVGRNPYGVFPSLDLTKAMDGYSFRCRVTSVVPETNTYDTIYSNTPWQQYKKAVLTVEDLCHLNPVISLMTTKPICSGDEATMKVTTDIPLKAGAVIEWFVNGVSKQKGTGTTFKTKLYPGDQVQAKITNGADCPNENPTPSEIFKPAVRYLPSIDLRDNFSIRVNTDTTLFARVESMYDGKLDIDWTPKDYLVTPGHCQRTVAFSQTDIERTTRLTKPTYYYITVTEDVYGCTGRDSVKINVYGGSLAVDPDQRFVVCENDTVTLMAEPYGGSGEYHYTYSAEPADETGELAAAPDTNEIRFVAPVGTNVYTITVFDGVSTVKKRITVTVNKRMLSQPKITGDTAVCDGNDFVLSVQNDAYAGTSPSYQWYFNGSVVPTAVSGTYKPDKNLVDSGVTQIYCRVTTSYDCPVQKTVNTEPVTLHIWPMPAIASISADTQICQNIPVRLKVMTFQADSVHWSPEKGLSSATVTNPVATPAKTTTYTATAFTKHGCQVSESMTMTILPATSVQARYKDVYACNNAAAALPVVSKGVDLKFRWQKFNKTANDWDELPEGGRYSYAANGNLDISKVDMDDNDTRYRVIATGYCDPIDTSVAMTLHIIEDVVLEIAADEEEACAGQPITFRAKTNIKSAVTMFEWRINGSTYGYSYYYGYTYRRDTLRVSLKAGDKVQCFIHVNDMVKQCVQPHPFPSNVIAPTIYPNPDMSFRTVNPSECSAADGSITVNATSGTTPYQYSYDGGTTFGTSNVLANIPAGYYRVQVRDDKSCVSAVKGVSLYDPSAPMTPVFKNTGLYCLGSSPDYIIFVD
ncbi:MAG: SprB repeat-containing protein, partial [Bacteroidales bacterium]|nr:SprB repeat-containing protein [Bacteroidales bacterium]